jgi:DNA-binding NtrC family response regulator
VISQGGEETVVTAKILIVDDDEEYRDLLSKILKKEGYIVRTAENIDAAIEELERESYAIVTVDMKFKTGSTEVIVGEDLLIYLRDKHERTKCIIVSGSPEVSKPGEAANLGRKYGAWLVPKEGLNTAKFVALVKEVLQEVAPAHGKGEENVRVESLQKQLTDHRRTLGRLKEKLAKYTELEAPVSLLNQIEDEEKEIAKLEAELQI